MGSAGESKGSVNENAAKALESIVKGTWMVPKFAANIATLWTTTTVQNDTENAVKKELTGRP